MKPFITKRISEGWSWKLNAQSAISNTTPATSNNILKKPILIFKIFIKRLRSSNLSINYISTNIKKKNRTLWLFAIKFWVMSCNAHIFVFFFQ